MKKKIGCVLLLLFMCSGCTVIQISSYEEILQEAVNKNTVTTNVSRVGYKYYLPKGMRLLEHEESNELLAHNEDVYYLYVDYISYYNKIKEDYEEKEDVVYSQKIAHGDNFGYLEIKNTLNDKYFIEIMYNYAKIETYVDESCLNEAISDISYILSSIDFNDSLLKKMYESGDLDSKEEVYKLFENKEREGNFLEYIEEYDKYDGSADEVEEKEIIVEETTEQKSTTTTKSSEPTTSETTQNDNGSDGE